MWPRKINHLLVCLWIIGAPCVIPALVSAQTPLDGQAIGLLTALRGPWGNLIIAGGTIVIAITILIGLQHPVVLIYAGIGFFVLFMIGSALSGNMYTWLVGG